MFRRILSATLIPLLLVSQVLAAGAAHAHEGVQAADHDSRPHIHIHEAGCGHHHAHDHHHPVAPKANAAADGVPIVSENGDHDSAIYLAADVVDGVVQRLLQFGDVGPAQTPAGLVAKTTSPEIGPWTPAAPPPDSRGPPYLRMLVLRI